MLKWATLEAIVIIIGHQYRKLRPDPILPADATQAAAAAGADTYCLSSLIKRLSHSQSVRGSESLALIRCGPVVLVDQEPRGEVRTFCCGVCSSRGTTFSVSQANNCFISCLKFTHEAIKARLSFTCRGSGRRISFSTVTISGIFTCPCQSLSEVVSGSQGVHDVHVQ